MSDSFVPPPLTPSLSPLQARQRQKSLTRRTASTSADVLSTPALSRSTKSAAPPPLPLANTSPHYATSSRSRHSLYGTEDRIVLDLGSKVWKVGFSGEGAPRCCLLAPTPFVSTSSYTPTPVELKEIEEEFLKQHLRKVYFDLLMTDPKSRKVLIVENVWLDLKKKEMILRVLFGNLQVPSINFCCGGLLALLSTGNVHGLVVDCGNTETTILPIYSARPLHPYLLTTPRSTSRISLRLKSLLHHFGTYVPPPVSLNSITPPTMPLKQGVPIAVLTDEVVDEIRERCCFIGEKIDLIPGVGVGGGGGWMESTEGEYSELEDVKLMNSLEAKYKSQSTRDGTTEVTFPIEGGKGWILVPGWVRERCGEALWDEGDEDEFSLVGGVLEALKKLPIDLRRPLAAKVLITGGGSMIPGFFPRFLSEVSAALSPPPPSSTLSSPSSSPSKKRPRPPPKQKYSSLQPLSSTISLINHPSSSSFTPNLLPWVGGSLAGALKTGGVEILRNVWEESGEELGDWSWRGAEFLEK